MLPSGSNQAKSQTFPKDEWEGKHTVGNTQDMLENMKGKESWLLAVLMGASPTMNMIS